MKAVSVLTFVIIAGFTFCSCSKTNIAPAIGTTTYDSLPQAVRNIVPDSLIDTLKAHGMPLYVGNTPPIVNGIYLLTPYTIIYDNSGLTAPGTTINDYKLKFYNQNNTTHVINYVDTGLVGGEVDTATTAFVTGHGNFFTLYSILNGGGGGYNYTAIDIISGELTSNGIADYEEAYSLVSSSTNTQIGADIMYALSLNATVTANYAATYRPALSRPNNISLLNGKGR
jgi:hypothetical protein